MKVVRRPQDRRIARSERAPGALQFRSADCLAAPDASQVEEARGANHTVERELLHGQSVRIEAERPVEVCSHVVRGQEDTALA